MRFDTRFYALMSGAALTLSPVAAQTERAAAAKPAAAAQAASQFASSPREKLVVAMPKGCPEQLEFVSATRAPFSDSALDAV